MLEHFVMAIVRILFSFPGAGIRYLLNRGKIPFNELQRDMYYNSQIVLGIIALSYFIYHNI